MRTTTMTLLILIVPSLLAAQSPAADSSPMRGLSAQGRVQAEATLQAARDQGLPEQPLHAVMFEGQAKGATEAQILAAEQQALARLEAAPAAEITSGIGDVSTDASASAAVDLSTGGLAGALSAVGGTGATAGVSGGVLGR